MNEFTIKPIAHIENDFTSKFGIPRQSGIAHDVVSYVIFEPEYRSAEALRGIEEYSHLWLIWQFSEALSGSDGFRPTVRPPRLGGNKRVGVFATRSPFRPNSLGLSSVRLAGVEKTHEHGMVLKVLGADLMNGTPIFDIKPYVKYSDSHPDAKCSFSDNFSEYQLEVVVPDEARDLVPEDKLLPLIEALKSDPRPSYQHNAERMYYFEYADLSVSFYVDEKTLTVTQITKKY